MLNQVDKNKRRLSNVSFSISCHFMISISLSQATSYIYKKNISHYGSGMNLKFIQ